MAKDSSIEWTHHTFNPWWGCVRVSPGCVHCYAETFDKRVHGKEKAHWGVQASRRFFGDKHWNEPLRWDREAAAAGQRHRVFCASMADVFEDRPELVEPRARLFLLIQNTPHLDWLLLTKRPENMVRLAPEEWAAGWPANVWAGCTAEDQQRADERIPELLAVPAQVRFLSCEPLLGPVYLKLGNGVADLPDWVTRGDLLHWIIIGGESGPGSRPFNLEWARDLVRQCRDADAAPFVKQLGGRPVGIADRISHRGDTTERPNGFYRFLNDAKGGDWSEWPEDLRVREFPESAALLPTSEES